MNAGRIGIHEIDGATALALLEWQVELGADEPMLDAPADRFAESAAPRVPPAPASAPPPRAAGAATAASAAAPSATAPAGAPDVPAHDVVAEAEALAAAARDLPGLAAAQERFDGIALKRGARNFVFSDGRPGARVMIIGEAPGEEEDQQGRPFVGRAGQLLDQMFAAIGMDRHATDAERALYITNVLPWHPPGNRRPEPAEIAASLPFLARHVELAGPDVLVLMGNSACQAVLGRVGITRLRGNWASAFHRPALPMTHPAYLLRNPIAKREAWADLLSLQTWLESHPAGS